MCAGCSAWPSQYTTGPSPRPDLQLGWLVWLVDQQGKENRSVTMQRLVKSEWHGWVCTSTIPLFGRSCATMRNVQQQRPRLRRAELNQRQCMGGLAENVYPLAKLQHHPRTPGWPRSPLHELKKKIRAATTSGRAGAESDYLLAELHS